jgi:hypothetical protein
LQLNLPIFQGGSANSKVREAVAGQEKARQDLELVNRQAALQTRQAFLGVTSGLAQVKALEQALVSSQSSLDSTRLGQEVGVRTNVDVLNAQQQLYTAKRDLSQARYNYILSQLKLKSAVGVLQDEDVEQVNRWLGSGSTSTTELLKKSASSRPIVPAAPSTQSSQSGDLPENLLNKSLEAWAAAWSSRNAQAYLDVYAPGFVPADGSSNEAWSANRKEMLTRAKDISIDIADIKIVMQGEQRASTEFKQTYRSATYHDVVNKKLEWERVGNQWLIVSELAIKPLSVAAVR